MTLDIKTLMLLYLIINLISAGAIAIIWNQNRRRFAGISFWLTDMILQATGSMLIILRGIVPDFLSIVVANTLVQAGIIIILTGLQRFTGKKGGQIHNYVLLAVFIGVSTYFSIIQPNLTIREISISAMIVIFTFQCAWLLLRRVGPGMRRITQTTGIVFSCYAAFNLGRFVLQLIFPSANNDFFKSGLIDSLSITIYIILSVCLTISLILLVNKRLLGEVKTQEEKFGIAFHSSPYAITLTKPSNGQILEFNEGFLNITGYELTEIIGKTTLDLNLWAREKDRREVVNELLKGNKVHDREYQFRKKNGEIITGLFSADTIRINGQTFILSTINDITARKTAEEKIIKFNSILEQRVHERTAQLESSNKEVESFAYSVSHDLRAPLRAIDGYTQILQEDYASSMDSEGKRILSAVRQNTNRMAELIEGLLTLTRLGRSEMHYSGIDMKALADSVINEITTPESRQSIDLRLDALPEAIGDVTLIKQVWTNLLSNSVKFSSKREQPVITIKGKMAENELIYSLQDNGAGFDIRYVDKLYGTFQRLHTLDEFVGHGIGLAIVQRIIHRHGGRVWAEGELDKGAIFYFTLPVRGEKS
jgi:PAS domain S-box-containing protein